MFTDIICYEKVTFFQIPCIYNGRFRKVINYCYNRGLLILLDVFIISDKVLAGNLGN